MHEPIFKNLSKSRFFLQFQRDRLSKWDGAVISDTLDIYLASWLLLCWTTLSLSLFLFTFIVVLTVLSYFLREHTGQLSVPIVNLSDFDRMAVYIDIRPPARVIHTQNSKITTNSLFWCWQHVDASCNSTDSFLHSPYRRYSKIVDQISLKNAEYLYPCV